MIFSTNLIKTLIVTNDFKGYFDLLRHDYPNKAFPSSHPATAHNYGLAASFAALTPPKSRASKPKWIDG